MSPLTCTIAPLGVGGLARQREVAGEVAVEGHAVGEQVVDAAPAPRATISRAIRSSTMPAPAAMVSAACCSGESPGATAAAMPPCAQADEAPSPSGAAASTVTGRGARRSAQNRPASPPPTMTTSSVR